MRDQRIHQKIFSLLLISFITFSLPAQSTPVNPTKIHYPVFRDTSRALSEIIVHAIPGEPVIRPFREMLTHEIPDKVTPRAPLLNYDPVAQTESGHQLPLQLTAGFEGIDNLCNCWPPDPNGDVGGNYYFQTVNFHFAIYDKHGNLLKGPFHMDSLWAGFTGPWTSMNKSDPIVLYDHLAHRWLVTILAYNFSGDPDYELIAVSQSSDPLGAWYRYAYQFNYLPDYPKFAVWPDGYYMSANRFTLGYWPSFKGMAAYVFERDSMLAGRNARLVSFTSFPDSEVGHGLLPSDLDGPPPPLNTPNYFAYVVDGETMGGSDRIGIFELHVDWSNPSVSSFVGPVTLVPAAFNRLCAGTRDCIPQLNSPEGLDALGDRLMHRLQYRNFGSYQAMVANHTVDAGNGRAGIRWYEFRDEGSGWNIYQQGTYAPQDGLHRWMGSIAMDKFGNIALGYSTSSSSTYPDIRATGRKFNDPLGQITAEETVIKPGTGSQNGGYNRWGDYSMMTVDPEDEVTFWYTMEYYQNTGDHWQTYIGAFYIPWPVVVDQLRENGSRLENTTVGRWNGAVFEALQVPDTIPAKLSSREVLRGYQDLVTNPEEKYRVWERNYIEQLDTLQNHRGFTIDQYLNNLTSRFHPTYSGITLRNELISAPGSEGGIIEFKDPWLIDYADTVYGNNLRNRGMDAPFKSRPSPFTPDYTTSYNGDVYQGVFLNQGYNQGQWAPPYYSVRALQEQVIPFHGEDITWYFQGWAGTM